MTIIAKDRINPLQDSTFFDKDVIFAVDENVGYFQVLEQRLQGAKTEDFIQQVGLNFLLFTKLSGTP